MTANTIHALCDERLAERFPDAARRASVASKLTALLKDLAASDALAKATIEHAQGKSVAAPDGGVLQLGFVLYWAKHEPDVIQKLLKNHPELQKAWDVVGFLLTLLDPPTVTPAEYEFALARLKADGLVGPDGQILGDGKYQGADPDWMLAFFNYVLNLIEPSSIAPFTNGAAKPFVAPLEPCGPAGKPVRIAVIGDWGTGAFDGGGYDPASDVLKTVADLKPDYVVHLGDVYYSGSDERPMPGEESARLVAMWPKMPPERSFTLNSNHEMYGGAQGYFQVALGRDGSTTPFAHQNGLSYFALTRGDWAFVGLDAAYFDPSSLYMDGGLGAPGADPQYAFLEAIDREFKNVVLFSHQTAMSTDGSTPMQLWSDVTSVLAPEKIRLWYWGHIHLGLVYGAGSALGAKGVRARCAGHSAIPIGDAWGLKGAAGIEWLAHTPVGPPAYPNRVRNGFALLTVSDSGVDEAFYDAGDATRPAWSESSAR